MAITGGATVASLSLPAGSYLIQGKLNAVHNGTASSTRLESRWSTGRRPSTSSSSDWPPTTARKP